MPFEIAAFVGACRGAGREAQPQLAGRDVVARAMEAFPVADRAWHARRQHPAHA